MQAHSASERSVGYLFLMRARVANHYPTHPFRTVSEGAFSEVRLLGVLGSWPSAEVQHVRAYPGSIVRGHDGSGEEGEADEGRNQAGRTGPRAAGANQDPARARAALLVGAGARRAGLRLRPRPPRPRRLFRGA